MSAWKPPPPGMFKSPKKYDRPGKYSTQWQLNEIRKALKGKGKSC